MFFFRNILPALCWVCCSASLFAQDIDYSKCSCDSIARHFTTTLSKPDDDSSINLKDTTIKSFVDGFEREIEIGKINWDWKNKSQISYGLKKCTYKKGSDSIIVRYYVDNIIQAQGANRKFHFGEKYLAYYYNDEQITNPEKKGRGIWYINFKTDSIIYSANKVSYYVFSHFPFSDSIKNKYKFNLKRELYIDMKGNDSIIYTYYLPDQLFYFALTKRKLNKIKNNYKPILLAQSTPLDINNKQHGRYLAFDYKGKKMLEINYIHGIEDGKYYYKSPVWNMRRGYEKGQYSKGKKTGKWIYKTERWNIGSRKYRMRYDESGKPKRPRLPKNDKQALKYTIKRTEIGDDGDISIGEPIPTVNSDFYDFLFWSRRQE